jgi:hypothetical protein
MARFLHVGESWRSRGHFERFDHNAAGLSIAVAEWDPATQSHIVHVDSRERLRERKDSRIVFQDQPHGRSGEELEMARFAQKHDTERVIQLGVGDDDALDWYVPNPRWNRARQAVKLLMDVGRRVQKEPALSIYTHRRGGLAATDRLVRGVPSHSADRTPAVPLRETTSCRGAQ